MTPTRPQPARSNPPRLTFGVAIVAAAALFGATACGGGGTSDSATPITVTATNYVTIPAATTTVAPTTTVALEAGAVMQQQSTYVIVDGDFPSTIASLFKISLDDLLSANSWTLNSNGIVPEWPGVGATIVIPAGATFPGAPTGTMAPATNSGDAAATPTTLDQCAAGTYVILETDTARVIVAEKFDVTVEALDAANANTPGYSGFYPGLTIIIPAKDC